MTSSGSSMNYIGCMCNRQISFPILITLFFVWNIVTRIFSCLRGKTQPLKGSVLGLQPYRETSNVTLLLKMKMHSPFLYSCTWSRGRHPVTAVFSGPFLPNGPIWRGQPESQDIGRQPVLAGAIFELSWRPDFLQIVMS